MPIKALHGTKSYMNMRYFIQAFSLPLLSILLACGGKKSKDAAEETNNISQEEMTTAPLRSMLDPDELIALSRSANAAEVQLYMKEKTGIFFYARKGEYLSLAQGAVTDTAGRAVSIPLSTVYFASEPGATWRIAQTLHRPELSDSLLSAFRQKGFVRKDSIRYYATESICYRYSSPQYPGILLYHAPSIRPWYYKGLYNGSGWMGYVFEIHQAKE